MYRKTPNCLKNIIPRAPINKSEITYIPALKVQEAIRFWKYLRLEIDLDSHIKRKTFGKNINDNKFARKSD
jgi:hypothetical protein